MDAYTPVSCDLHDELESLATLRQTCRIVYRTETNATSEIAGRIVDVYAANHADYVKLQDGTVIRLDRIVSVNDKPVSFYIDEPS
jgi:Rho-binding antiterminator